MNPKCVMRTEGSQVQKACDSTYVTLWERQKYRGRKQVNGCQGLKWGIGWEFFGILGSFSILHVVVVISIYTCVKMHRTVHPKVNFTMFKVLKISMWQGEMNSYTEHGTFYLLRTHRP